MRLDNLSVSGFGRLVGAKFTFQPGLNLIIGPNEAGKSTLLQAIFSLLYGFFDTGSVTGSRRELLDAYRPWDESAAYHGSLAFNLHDGKRYLVERTFGPSRMSTSLMTLPGKKDISNTFEAESYGRLHFAEKMLGLSRTVFENTCYLRQTELAKLDGSAAALTEAIVRLTSSGSADASANSAVEMLKQVLRDEIGTTRAWTKPLAAAQKQVDQLRKAYEVEVHNQEQLWSWLQEIGQYETRLTFLSQQKDQQTYLKLLAEQAERRSSISRLEQAKQDVERHRKNVAKLAVYANVAVDRRDELLSRTTEWRQLKAAVAYSAPREAELRAQLAQITARIEQLDVKAQSSGSGLRLQPIIRDQILSLRAQWQHALDNQQQEARKLASLDEQLRNVRQRLDTSRSTAQKSVALGTAGLARLQTSLDDARRDLADKEQRYSLAVGEWERVGMSEDQFRALADQVEAQNTGAIKAPPPRRGCNLFAKSAPAVDEEPTETVIFKDIAPIHSELEQAAAARMNAQHQYSTAEQLARSALGLNGTEPLTDEIFRRKADELTQISKLEIELSMLDSSREEAAGRKSQLENATYESATRLLTVLSEQGIAAGDPARGVDTYLAAYEEQDRYENAYAEANTLRKQSELLVTQINQAEQGHRDLTRAEERVCSLLAEVGIGLGSARSIDEGMEEYRRLCEQHEQWVVATRVLNSSEEQLQLLQQIGQDDGTVHQIEVTERRLRQMLDSHPEWKQLIATLPEADYARQVSETQDTIEQTRAEVIRLRHLVESLEERTIALAELDEQRTLAESRFEELSTASTRFTKAIDMLQEATIEYQKAFAPRLETQIARRLDRVTRGRYQKTRVNPLDLALDLWSPDTNAWVPTERLSTGTRDLVYLVTRIELSNILSGGREPLPLLLDDPFVHLDTDREQQALAYICDIAEDCQVLYFSKDLSLAERLNGTIDKAAVIQLGLGTTFST